GDVVDHTGFVIGMHDRHQSGVRPQYRTHIVGTDYTIRTRRQPAHLIAFALEKTHAVDHRLVLGSGRDQMTTTGLARLRRALDRQVVGFGGATGPDDFAWVGIYQVGDLAARVFHRFLGKPAIHVRTRGRIAENAIHAQAFIHTHNDTRIHRRGRRIIKVDRFFHDWIRLSRRGSRCWFWRSAIRRTSWRSTRSPRVMSVRNWWMRSDRSDHR